MIRSLLLHTRYVGEEENDGVFVVLELVSFQSRGEIEAGRQTDRQVLRSWLGAMSKMIDDREANERRRKERKNISGNFFRFYLLPFLMLIISWKQAGRVEEKI